MKLLTVLFLILCEVATAQCLSGDCKDGQGVYDFGYALYTGSFKNGKPHGRGLMDYGNGQKYEGNFSNGLEDGQGVLHKDGSTRQVLYRNGKIENFVTIIGGHAPKIEGCRGGDCYNGNGEMSYPSGNTYAGQFQNGQRHGSGTFKFVSGNTFTGTFENDTPIAGTFKYSREGVTFIGTVNSECVPQTGKYHYPNNESTVTIENGSITSILNPMADRAKAEIRQLENAQKPVTCSRCNGKGISGSSRVSVTNTVENVGVDRYLNGRYTTTTRYGDTLFPNICTECGGKGVKLHR